MGEICSTQLLSAVLQDRDDCQTDDQCVSGQGNCEFICDTTSQTVDQSCSCKIGMLFVSLLLYPFLLLTVCPSPLPLLPPHRRPSPSPPHYLHVSLSLTSPRLPPPHVSSPFPPHCLPLTVSPHDLRLMSLFFHITLSCPQFFNELIRQ